MKTERWAFTRAELKDPSKCTGNDEFLARVPDHGPVIVYRDGTVSNRWYDGTAGVPTEIAVLAGEDESPFNQDTGELAATWRDMTVDDAGNFLAFA